MAIVSVILDVSNDVSPALESILAQTFQDFEIIKAARNDGLTRARGKYVYFMDSDGMIFDNGLECLVSTAEKTGADIVHSTLYVERDGENVEVVVADKNSPSCLNLYRREFLENNRLKFPSSDNDEAFCYAAACLATRIENVDEYFYVGDRHPTADDDNAIYVRDINRDEIRSGFLVTSQRKYLWNAQIKLIREFARICQKHGLKWFAHAGTLLGAVRHKGFIPWDDDVDLAMLRPDFNKFIEVAPAELKSQFFLDLPYNHAIEGEPNAEKLPIISRELYATIKSKGWRWPTFADFFKLRDSTTSQIQWRDRPHVNQGIWIDIFPFDPVPPFDDRQHQLEHAIKKELMMTVYFPDVVWKAIDAGEELLLADDILKNLLSLPFKQRMITCFEQLNKTYFDAKYFGRLKSYLLTGYTRIWSASIFRDVLQLPFEQTNIFVPIEYEAYLDIFFKDDWREMIFNQSHVSTASTDISYREFFERVSPTIKEFNF